MKRIGLIAVIALVGLGALGAFCWYVGSALSLVGSAAVGTLPAAMAGSDNSTTSKFDSVRDLAPAYPVSPLDTLQSPERTS